MGIDLFPYLVPYIVSAFISLGVAFYAWQRRHEPGTRPFLVMVLSQAFWTVCYVFELASPTLQGKIFWDNMQFVASLVWPLSYFMFVCEFSGRQWRRPRLTWVLLSLPSILFLVLIVTDGRHHLIRPQSILVSGAPFDALVYEFSTAVMITAVYIYGLVFAGIYVLAKSFVNAKKLYRKQAGFVILGTLVPISGTLLTLVGVTITNQRDTTPLTFAISNVIIALALYRYGLFNIVPIARDKVIEEMSDLVFVLDAQNRFVDVNYATEQVLERRNGDVIGKPANEILEKWPYLLPLLESEKEAVTEVEIVYDCEVYYLAVKVAPLHDDRERMNGRLVVARDVTGMKLVERSLQEQADQLEKTNQGLRDLSEVKDEFVTNVSHELRTPLANLKLYHDLLVRKPDRLITYVEILERETTRLELIIEDLLTLSRLDQHDSTLQTEQTDLNKLVKTLVLDRQKLVAQSSINLQVTAITGLPDVAINASMITQVLSILLTNSVNYTLAGGEIVVYTKMEKINERDWVGFCVQDTGHGITADDQAQLFVRFFRGDASKYQGNAGTGLGLAIAQEIIDLHHGKIEVVSTGVPGEGTAVTVLLPVKTIQSHLLDVNKL